MAGAGAAGGETKSDVADGCRAASDAAHGAESVATFNKKHFAKRGCKIFGQL